MSTRDWLARELDDESQTDAGVEQPEEPWFDAALSAAAAGVDWSDRTIDLMVEIVEPRDAASSTLPAVLATDPAIGTRREALGMSADEAGRQVGVSPAVYETLERSPLRWLNVPDTGKVSSYLAQLGVSRGVFLRWLASLRPADAGYAWGYRPGAVLDRPVAAADDDQGHFFAWGAQLLGEEAPTGPAGDSPQLFGYAWSPQASAGRTAAIRAAAQARLLAADNRTDQPLESSEAGVIALPSAEGLVYPAFQFDEHDRLLPIVAEINELLGAAEDPWGVADWWLSDDASLGARPVDLIAGIRADHDGLRRAAHALLEADW